MNKLGLGKCVSVGRPRTFAPSQYKVRQEVFSNSMLIRFETGINENLFGFSVSSCIFISLVTYVVVSCQYQLEATVSNNLELRCLSLCPTLSLS